MEPARGRISRRGAREAADASIAFPPVDPELGARALDVVGAIAEAADVTLAQVSIAWLLAQPVVTSVIIGASTMAQLDDNLAAADLVLTPDELLRLDVRDGADAGLPGVVGHGDGRHVVRFAVARTSEHVGELRPDRTIGDEPVGPDRFPLERDSHARRVDDVAYRRSRSTTPSDS